MTVMELLQMPLREVPVTCVMLLLVIQGYLCLFLYQNKMSGKLPGIQLTHLCATVIILYMLLNLIQYTDDQPGIYHSADLLPGHVPAVFLLLYLLVSTAGVVWEIIRIHRFRRDHITPTSIKEAMDHLPAGIAFADAEGNIILSNLVMRRLARRFTGKTLSVLTELEEIPGMQEWMISRNAQAGVVSAQAAVQAGCVQAAVPDGSGVWQFTAEQITEGERPLLQLIAVDISEQARIAEELKSRNEKLKDLQMRLAIYNRQAERITIAKELLDARIQVHSEAGQVLLMSRHYLEHPDRINEEVLLDTLKNTNFYLLREYEEDDTARDPLLDALEMAEAIGVEVDLFGEYPNAETLREILGAAIGECATNTVKHAGGNHLYVQVEEDGGTVTYRLRGNGDLPAEGASPDALEGGGLSSLRRRVESAGGQLQILTSPEFTVAVTLETAQRNSFDAAKLAVSSDRRPGAEMKSK